VEKPPVECFTGTLLCQHGQAECVNNAFEQCAKSLYPDPAVYMEYVYCLEGNYPTAGKSCAEIFSLSFDEIRDCSLDPVQRKKVQLKNAIPTAKALIPGTPTVVLNGQQLEDTSNLLAKVCAAYNGTPPPGCTVSSTM